MDAQETSKEDLVYRVDEGDKIVFVSDSWTSFAASNGADLSPAKILGRSIWDFIADPTTQHLYQEMLVRVRAGRQVDFTLRCDAPDKRRLLEMTIALGPDRTVEFRTRTLKEETRPPVPLTAPSASPDNLLSSCGWCQRVRVGGAWAEVEDAVACLRLFDSSRLPMLSHGICDDCLASVTKTMNLTAPK